MTLPTKQQRPLTGWKLLLAAVAVLALFPLFGICQFLFALLCVALHLTGAPVAPQEAALSVAVILMNWDLLGKAPDRNPDYSNLEKSIARRIKGINGFTESDPFHGDGSDWCEVELSPDLAAELRLRLEQTSVVKKNGSFPH